MCDYSSRKKRTLKDKVILIVGGTGGIGSALASNLSEQGARIVIAGRNRSKAEEIAKELNANGGDAYAIDVDVTNPSSVKNLAEQVKDGLGKVDVLVNAFGQGIIQSITDIDHQAAKEIIDVNVYGTFLVTQTLLPYMNENSHVLMFPGTMGKFVMKNSSVYSASKFAIQGFTKALTEELKRESVNFTLFYLGGVNTPFWDDDRVQMRVKKEAMLSPESVAETVTATLSLPSTAVVNEVVMQPESHQLV
jgi:short-subunit dehydrogenase